MNYVYSFIAIVFYTLFLYLAFWSRSVAKTFVMFPALSQLYWVLCCFAILLAMMCAILGFIAISQKKIKRGENVHSSIVFLRL